MCSNKLIKVELGYGVFFSYLSERHFSNQISIKLRMEMGNVSKRQQPDQRSENSQRQTNGSLTLQENPALLMI